MKRHVLYFSQTIHVTLVHGPSVAHKYKVFHKCLPLKHSPRNSLLIFLGRRQNGKGQPTSYSTVAGFCVWNLLIIALNGCINVETASSSACSCIDLVGGVSCGSLLAASPAVVLL